VRRRVSAGLLGVIVALPAAAGTAAPGAAATGAVLDLRLPVRDLALTVDDLDGAVSETVSPAGTTITLAADVLFPFDRADLTPRAARILADVTARLRPLMAAGHVVRVDGHTDAKGTAAYNLDLSSRRAMAVRAAFAGLLPTHGVTFVVRGHGETAPVAPNTRPDGSDDPVGRAKNRRVTVAVGR
jgi:outer membrane protein OmpA-like peptidoglycan-associated protein